MPDLRRIVVRTPNWVGDAVMALPFLASLRLNAQEAHISVLTRPFLAELFRQVEPCDEVLELDETGGRHGLLTVWRNARELRTHEFDMAFCLPPSFGSALMMRLAAIRRRIGHASDGRGWLLTDKVPYLPNGQRPHRALGYISLLNLAFPNAVTDRRLHLECGVEAKQSVDGIFRQRGILGSERVLAMAPGAAQPNKLWRSDRFAAIARKWIEQESSKVVIVGGVADKAVAEVVMTESNSSRIANFCGVGSLLIAGEIIRRASVFVGNDSGLSHLAAAVGTPLVAISGPGDPSEVAPFSDKATTVKKSLYCSPCYSNRCYRTDHPLECQDLVSVAEVWDAVHTASLAAGNRS